MQWTKIVQRRSGDVVILQVRGTMTLSASPADLVTLINRLVKQGDRKILLNLRQVPFIDSQGLADIVDGFRIARSAGGALQLCQVAERIRDLLKVTKLATVIQAFDSEEEALNGSRSL